MTPQQYFDLVIPTVDMSIRSELYHTNEFNFAVAVILSAQATDKKVNEVTPKLFHIAPTPKKMLELGIDGLKEHIKVISPDEIVNKIVETMEENLKKYRK